MSDESKTQEVMLDENEQIAQRKAKLADLRQSGQAYPNHFRCEHLAAELKSTYDHLSHEALEKQAISVKLAGRLMTRRVMGKASFAHIQDMSGKIQLYVARDHLPAGQYDAFKEWDLGDILGVSGVLFRTKTGELSVKVDHIDLLTKALAACRINFMVCKIRSSDFVSVISI